MSHEERCPNGCGQGYRWVEEPGYQSRVMEYVRECPVCRYSPEREVLPDGFDSTGTPCRWSVRKRDGRWWAAPPGNDRKLVDESVPFDTWEEAYFWSSHPFRRLESWLAKQ
jgi:hypothetical protein